MKKDPTPWLLLPGIVLALSSVTLLAPHGAAQAAPPVPVQPAPAAAAYDDGDGDELLEHWDNVPYTQEALRQMAGMAAGFAVLGTLAYRRRLRRRPQAEVVPLPRAADFLKLDSASQHADPQHADPQHADAQTRKAA